MLTYQFCKQEARRWGETHARCPSSEEFRGFDLPTILPPLVSWVQTSIESLGLTNIIGAKANIIFNHGTLVVWVAWLSSVACEAMPKTFDQCSWCWSRRDQLDHANFAWAVSQWRFRESLHGTKRKRGVQGSANVFLGFFAATLSRI